MQSGNVNGLSASNQQSHKDRRGTGAGISPTQTPGDPRSEWQCVSSTEGGIRKGSSVTVRLQAGIRGIEGVVTRGGQYI